MSIRPETSRAKRISLPFEPGMTVQNAVDAAKLPRQFKKMKINVMRVTPQSNGQRVPLRAEYDAVARRVSILHDMTLHPGDHIMVEEDTSSQVSQLLGSLSGAFDRRRR